MSTALEQPTKKYVDSDEYIEIQLRKTRSNIKLTDLLTAAGGVLVLFVGYLLLFVVLDHWVIEGGFGYAARVFMLSMLGVAVAVWVAWKIVVPWTRQVTALYAARAIEGMEPSLRSTLLNLVDLRRAGRPVSPQILATLEKRAARTLAHLDIDQAVDRRQLMRVSYALLVVVVAACMYTLFSPKNISDSVWRALFPASSVAAPTQTRIEAVKPGDVEVLARTHLEVIAEISGDEPERVLLYYTTADERHVDEPIEMHAEDNGFREYRAVLTGENGRGILQDMSYRIEAGDDRTRNYRITVNQPPSFTVQDVRYEFPEYMEMEPRTSSGGHIDAWEGTKVTISGAANMDLKSFHVVFAAENGTAVEYGTTADIDVPGLQASWVLSLTHPNFYRVESMNLRGDTDPDPALHRIKVRPDQKPLVELLHPVSDLERPENAIVPFTVEARDPDFKLWSVELKFEKNGEPLPLGMYLLDPVELSPRQSLRVQRELPLERYNLQPGDEFAIYVEAIDNKKPNPNVTRTTPRVIRITAPASKADVQEQLEQDKQEQEERLEELRQERNPEETDDAESQPGDGERGDGEDGAQPSGNAGESRPDAEAGEGMSDDPQPGETGRATNEGETGRPGDGRSGEPQKGTPKTDEGPADDEQALRELIDRYLDENEQEGEGDRPNDQQPPQPGGNNPPQSGDRNRDDMPERTNPPQPGEGEQPGGTGEKPKPDESPTGNDMSSGKKSNDPMEGDANGDQDGAGEASPSKPTPGEQQPGGPNEQGGEKSQPGPGGEKPRPSEKPLNGREEPADPSGDARQEQARGDEKGPATAADDPDADAPTAQNKLERQPGEKGPNSTQRSGDGPGKSGDAAGQKPASQPDATQPADSKSGDNASGGNKSSDSSPGKPPSDAGGKSGDSMSSKSGNSSDSKPSSNQSGEPADADGSDTPKPGDDSAKPADGSSASPSKDDPSQDMPAGGAGQSETQPENSKQPDGEPSPAGDSKQSPPGGEKSETGKPSQQGGDKGGEKGSSEGEGEAEGGAGSKAGDKPSSSQESGGSNASPGNGFSGNGAAQRGQDGAGAGGEGQLGGSPDEANLEHSKQAANLMLKRLEDDLRRGEVDEELLKQLGWSQDELESFSQRLKQQLQGLDTAEENSPADRARRIQFEEMLKSLDLATSSDRRGGNAGGRSTGGIGPRNVPVPAEYREAYEAFTRSISKRRGNNP